MGYGAAQPASGGAAVETGEQLLSTTVVDTNVGTKQALYTCPALKKCIITKVIVGGASASLAAMGDAITFGFNAGATDYGSLSGPQLAGLTDDTLALGFTQISTTSQGSVWTIGNASEVFGCVFNDVVITATAKVWVFGYVY